MKEKVKLSAKDRILRMVMIALFCALAFAVMPLFRINVMFLTFDIKDAIITIGGLLFGPVAALVISAVTALLEFVTIGDTGVYGLLMLYDIRKRNKEQGMTPGELRKYNKRLAKGESAEALAKEIEEKYGEKEK